MAQGDKCNRQGGKQTWIQEWKRLLFQLKLEELEGVVSKTTMTKKEVDKWVWKGGNSSQYLVKTTYKTIMANKRGVKDADPPSKVQLFVYQKLILEKQ